jgi:hypothetical protein
MKETPNPQDRISGRSSAAQVRERHIHRRFARGRRDGVSQSQCLCVSVNDIKGGYAYSDVVRSEIEEQDLASYLRAADFLNISNVNIVCFPHEFGKFNTLHTVLREPRVDRWRLMDELISKIPLKEPLAAMRSHYQTASTHS